MSEVTTSDHEVDADRVQPGGEPPDHGGSGEDGGGDGGPVGVPWSRVLVLTAALAFLGFGAGLFVAKDRPPASDSVDVGFYRDMTTHHEQALRLAGLELSDGSDPTVRGFAREVLTFQSYEIGVMRQTLRDWGYSPTERPDQAMAWMGMPVPVDEMPGLLSDGQLDAMREADGAAADALFLELMAEHHRGGLHMSAYAVDEAGDGDVRRLARNMTRNQAQEINEYRLEAQDEGYDVDIAPADPEP